MPIDVFVDLSGVPVGFDVAAAIKRLDAADSVGAMARRVTCTVAPEDITSVVREPAGWRIETRSPLEACRDALAAAGDDAMPLLVLLGDVRPSAAALGTLLDALDTDPMIGFAAARLAGHSTGSIARLDFTSDRGIDELPRRVLAEVPDMYIVADALGRCLLMKWSIAADFRDFDLRFHSLAGALWHYISRARRCGFRTVICNRVVVDAPHDSRPCPPCTVSLRTLPEADRVLLRELSADLEKTVTEFGTATAAVAETRLARALPEAYGVRSSLLLDCRNIVAGTNGTTVAALGICGGLHQLTGGWDVTLLAPKDASEAHRLESEYPDWQIETSLPARQFTAALRLSQPWHIQEMVDLHAAAAHNLYLFLDTISWDSVYPAPRHLDGTWRFLADQADGLIFISRYTRDRFHRRFAVRPGMRELIAYLSCDPADYAGANARTASRRDGFIFVVGNDYDHKDVSPTVELLAAAFPYQSFVALGPAQSVAPRVTMLESGMLSDAEIQRLYADARLVVFPSFYEGFGFPIVTALAYGRTLVARQSALLDEIAARCVPRGRLVPFARRDALVQIVGRILHDEDVATSPLGTALDDGQPLSWRDTASAILAFLTQIAGDVSRSQWRSRDHLIPQLLGAPMTLTDTGLKRSLVRST